MRKISLVVLPALFVACAGGVDNDTSACTAEALSCPEGQVECDPEELPEDCTEEIEGSEGKCVFRIYCMTVD